MWLGPLPLVAEGPRWRYVRLTCMINAQHFAITMARALEAIADRPDDIPGQKAALRALVALARLGEVMVTVGQGNLFVNRELVGPTLPGIEALASRLELHGVDEIRVAHKASAADLLTLLRALAERLIDHDPERNVEVRLQRSGSGSVAVRVSAAFAAITADNFPEPPLIELDPHAPDEEEPQETADVEEEERHRAVRASPDPRRAPHHDLLGGALDRISANPAAPDILDQLATAAQVIMLEQAQGGMSRVFHALEVLIGLEREAPEGPARRAFGITLKRLLTPPVLEQAAGLVLDPNTSQVATSVLVRAGGDGVEVLLKRLVEAPGARERRAYFDALKEAQSGVKQLIGLLNHQEWYVVRNAAELVGELLLEEAVPVLGNAMYHSDPRVRKAAAVAMARIGTPATVEFMRRALKEGEAEVKGLVAGAVAGRQSSALAMPLVLAAETETDAALRREYFRALGRIGTPDAIQALIKAVQPGGRFLRRRPPGPRIAAIDGLKLVGTPAAVGALEGLAEDPDREVRQAARLAVRELLGRSALPDA